MKTDFFLVIHRFPIWWSALKFIKEPPYIVLLFHLVQEMYTVKTKMFLRILKGCSTIFVVNTISVLYFLFNNPPYYNYLGVSKNSNFPCDFVKFYIFSIKQKFKSCKHRTLTSYCEKTIRCIKNMPKTKRVKKNLRIVFRIQKQHKKGFL